jgi:hypothetical protein
VTARVAHIGGARRTRGRGSGSGHVRNLLRRCDETADRKA